jgi:hypothetical protein
MKTPQKSQVQDQLALRPSRPLRNLREPKKTPKKSTLSFCFFPGAPDTSVHPVTYHNIF